MKILRLSLIAAALILTAGQSFTQELITTLGTTVDVAGQPHAYILWQPQASEESLFKRFAIYSKAGDSESPAVYLRESIQTLQSSPRTLRAMLELGSKLDRDPLGAARRIHGMFLDLTLRLGQQPANAADPNFDAAEKLAYILQASATEPKLLGRLFFLGRAHAGVMLALGHAFTRPLSGGIRTFEIREINANDADVRVLGRVTLDPGAPTLLAAPGAPVAIPHAVAVDTPYPVSSKDHLNTRLRWGVEGDLRSRLAHSFGFELFRVKKAVAESLGWHLTPPPSSEIMSLLAAVNPANPDPDLALANELPILVQRPLTNEEAANGGDQERIYFADDGVRHNGPDGRRVLRPYVDGESFYFFAAARDIAGRPGQLSRGTLVMMCDRLPPNPPRIESVLSTFSAPADKALLAQQKGSQFLQVKFRQLPDDQEEGAKTYFVYRWDSPQQFLEHLGDDPLEDLRLIEQNPQNALTRHVIAAVPHVEGVAVRALDDNARLNSPSFVTDPDRTVWYTVRAMGRTSCGGKPTLSGHSTPVPGVLRDFVAPNPPQGVVFLTQLKPVATFNRAIFSPAGGNDGTLLSQTRPSPDFVGFSLRITRVRTSISAALVKVFLTNRDPETNITNLNLMSSQTLVFPKMDADTDSGEDVFLHVPKQLTTDPSNNGTVVVHVQAVSGSGQLSSIAGTTLPAQERQFPSPYALALFTLDVESQTKPSTDFTTPVHDAINDNGSFNFVRGLLPYEELGIREWRVYRRVIPGGDLSLIAKGEGDPKEIASPKSIPAAEWEDTAPPATPGTTVCYYGQILDQNANASPLALLECVRITGFTLPTPMLLPVRSATSDQGPPKLRLEWLCDPVGVERFEVLVAKEGGGIPAIAGLTRVPRLGTAQNATEATLTLPEFPDLTFYVFQTNSLGLDKLGRGPEFQALLSLNEEELTTYYFAVRAVEPGPYPRAAGAVSNVETGAFELLSAEDSGVIPWPARPLPPSITNDLPEAAFGRGEGRFLTLKGYTDLPFDSFNNLSLASRDLFPAPTCFLIGAIFTPLSAELDGSLAKIQANEKEPEELFFKVRADRDNPMSAGPLGKFILYRYQIPTKNFPNAKPNLVQCTPLISEVSWGTGTIGTQTGRFVRDPYIAVFPIPSQPNSVIGVITQPPQLIARPLSVGAPVQTPGHLAGATGLICLKDPLPVIEGCRYQHVIVCLDERDEIRRVIRLDPVQH